MFRKRHHPVVVLILNVEFHAGKLGVVRTVHAFVAEVLADFEHTFETTYDEALQVKFGCDAAIEVDVERVVVCDEGTCACAACDALKDGRFDFSVACSVEFVAQCLHYDGALHEGVLHAFVHNEVNATLAVAKFGVFKCIVCHAVLVLHDGERLDALGEHGEFLRMNRDFARLRTEYVALDTDEVAEVEQLLEYCVVEFFVFAGADVVASDVNLCATLRVEQFDEGCLAHYAAAHHTTCDAHLAGLFFIFVKVFANVSRVCVDGIFCCRVGVDAHIAQLLKRIAASYFLFAKFKDIHL